MYLPFCLPPSWCSIVVYLHLPPPLASHLDQALGRCWREQSACRGSTASRLALVHLDRAWPSCASSWCRLQVPRQQGELHDAQASQLQQGCLSSRRRGCLSGQGSAQCWHG